MHEQGSLFDNNTGGNSAGTPGLHPDLERWPLLEEILRQWQSSGWIRSLDLAFGRFLYDLEPNTSPLVILAAVLTSHQLGRGHVCLDLPSVLGDPNSVLSLPPEGDFGEVRANRPKELIADLTIERWLDACRASALVGKGDNEQTPLILDQPGAIPTLYLRRQWHYEIAIAGELSRRFHTRGEAPANLSNHLDKLFPRADSAGEAPVNWQKIACALMARSRFGIITGGPGTGKTTTVVKLLGLLQSTHFENSGAGGGRPLRIRLAAPTGKAAARLTESISRAVDSLPAGMGEQIPTSVTTLHRLLGARPDTRRFVHHAGNPLHADWVVVDEASMIDLEMMYRLLDALSESTGLLLLGDKDQLSSVEAGSVLGDLCQNAELGGYSDATLAWLDAVTGQSVSDWQAASGKPSDKALLQSIAMLRYSHRFAPDSGIGRLAKAVNQGAIAEVDSILNGHFADLSQIPLSQTDLTRLRGLCLDGTGSDESSPCEERRGYRFYLEYMYGQRPGSNSSDEAIDQWARGVLERFGQFRLLTSLRAGPWGVEGLNQSIAQWLRGAGLIEREDGWYPGRPIIVTRNDYSLGLMNGDIGITLEVPAGDGLDPHLRVVFTRDDGSLRWVVPSRLSAVATVYAMTVHKSQGSEFAHTALLIPPSPNPILTRELIYTGVTRASRWFSLAQFNGHRLREALATPVRRASGLRARLEEC